MLVTGGVPTGIWPSVSLRPGGGVAVPGRPPAPLTAIEPDPLHGRPVIGFVPVALPPMAEVVPGKVPGFMGETGGSGISGRLNGLVEFCARTSRGLAFGGVGDVAKPLASQILANAPAPMIAAAAKAIRAVLFTHLAHIGPSSTSTNAKSLYHTGPQQRFRESNLQNSIAATAALQRMCTRSRCKRIPRDVRSGNADLS